MKRTQEAIYGALRADGAKSCFLRLSRDERSLWVTDFPRRQENTAGVEATLRMMDIECALDETSGLWRLSWTLAGWKRVLASLPKLPPSLPLVEKLHPAYALCRLLLCHPVPLEEQPMERLCQMAKATQGTEDALFRILPAFHSDAAKRLRTGQALPYDAGRILAAWLVQTDSQPKEAKV